MTTWTDQHESAHRAAAPRASLAGAESARSTGPVSGKNKRSVADKQTSHVACVPANFDWNDVGSWSAVRECFSQDSQGNTISGDVFTLETKNCVIHTTKPFVSIIGMENVTVVATEEAILVMPLDRSQDVKKIIAYLEQNKSSLL